MAERDDLTTYARIRNAALELFATRGVKPTTIRDVAAAARVSPGLVQHHFGTKAKLRQAVDEHVLEHAARTVGELPPPSDFETRANAFGERMAAVVRDHPMNLLYVARAAADGDETGLATFEAIAKLGRAGLEELEREGAIAEDVDLEWYALHMTVFNLGTLLFERAITRTLGKPLLSERELERWRESATWMFTRPLRRDAR